MVSRLSSRRTSFSLSSCEYSQISTQASRVAWSDYVLEIEHCVDCASHKHCTSHDEVKYRDYCSKVRAAVLRDFAGLEVSVNPGPDPYPFAARPRALRAGPYPRIGSFEIYLRTRGDSGNPTQKMLIWSKIKRRRWPEISNILSSLRDLQDSVLPGSVDKSANEHASRFSHVPKEDTRPAKKKNVWDLFNFILPDRCRGHGSKPAWEHVATSFGSDAPVPISRADLMYSHYVPRSQSPTLSDLGSLSLHEDSPSPWLGVGPSMPSCLSITPSPLGWTTSTPSTMTPSPFGWLDSATPSPPPQWYSEGPSPSPQGTLPGCASDSDDDAKQETKRTRKEQDEWCARNAMPCKEKEFKTPSSWTFHPEVYVGNSVALDDFGALHEPVAAGRKLECGTCFLSAMGDISSSELLRRMTSTRKGNPCTSVCNHCKMPICKACEDKPCLKRKAEWEALSRWEKIDDLYSMGKMDELEYRIMSRSLTPVFDRLHPDYAVYTMRASTPDRSRLDLLSPEVKVQLNAIGHNTKRRAILDPSASADVFTRLQVPKEELALPTVEYLPLVKKWRIEDVEESVLKHKCREPSKNREPKPCFICNVKGQQTGICDQCSFVLCLKCQTATLCEAAKQRWADTCTFDKLETLKSDGLISQHRYKMEKHCLTSVFDRLQDDGSRHKVIEAPVHSRVESRSPSKQLDDQTKVASTTHRKAIAKPDKSGIENRRYAKSERKLSKKVNTNDVVAKNANALREALGKV